MAKFCSSCGAPLDEGTKFCGKCGAAQGGAQQTAPPAQNYNPPPQRNYNPQARSGSRKDKTTAGILGIILGGIGAHKFYLGNTTKGIIYLLACWTAVPALVGLVEGIKYLTMSQEEFDAKYNNF